MVARLAKGTNSIKPILQQTARLAMAYSIGVGASLCLVVGLNGWPATLRSTGWWSDTTPIDRFLLSLWSHCHLYDAGSGAEAFYRRFGWLPSTMGTIRHEYAAPVATWLQILHASIIDSMITIVPFMGSVLWRASRLHLRIRTGAIMYSVFIFIGTMAGVEWLFGPNLSAPTGTMIIATRGLVLLRAWLAVTTYTAVPLLLGAWTLRATSQKLSSHGHCKSCSYLLFGLPSARCPECGTPFEESENALRQGAINIGK